MFIAYTKRANAKEAVEFTLEGNVLRNVEIFRTGVFRKQYFDKAYLDKMVSNFTFLKEMDVFRNVPIRVDHPDMLGIRNRMEGVAGYIIDLKIVENGKTNVNIYETDAAGNEVKVKKEVDDYRLVADMEITEPEVLEKIKRTTYRDRSIEFGVYDDNDGNSYEPTLVGVAFVDIPQVDKLKSMFSKYEQRDTDVITFSETTEDETKDEPVETKAEETTEQAKEETTTEPPIDVDNGKDMADTEAETETTTDEIKEEETQKVDGDTNTEETKTETEAESAGAETTDATTEEETVTKTFEKSMDIQEMEKELKALRREKFDREMEERYSYVNALVMSGYSTQAMAENEKQLIKSFFAAVGNEGYLNPIQQFELFKQIKASTPKVWEKKDDLKSVDDNSHRTAAFRDSLMGKIDNSFDASDDYTNEARKAIESAGLKPRE